LSYVDEHVTASSRVTPVVCLQETPGVRTEALRTVYEHSEFKQSPQHTIYKCTTRQTTNRVSMATFTSLGGSGGRKSNSTMWKCRNPSFRGSYRKESV